MESIKITVLKNRDKKILAIKLLRNHLRTNEQGGGFLDLKEAKDMIDDMHVGKYPDRLYVFNALTNEFKSMFAFESAPILKLYKVLVELDSPRSPLQTLMYEVIILAIGANSARVVALDSLTEKSGTAGYVRNVTEITEFKNNTILASYKVS